MLRAAHMHPAGATQSPRGSTQAPSLTVIRGKFKTCNTSDFRGMHFEFYFGVDVDLGERVLHTFTEDHPALAELLVMRI
jgi:hypothetical protein